MSYGAFILFRLIHGKSQMYRILPIYLLAFTFTICNVQAATEVGGIINVNTTWSLADSPYSVVNDVQLAYGATLTVEPNVVINGGGLSIKVWGTLDATGNEQSRIVFENVHIKPGISGSAITPYLISLKFCELNGGAIYEPTGSAIYGSLLLQDSILNGTSSFLHLWYPTSDCYVERNIFNNAKGIDAGMSGGVKVYVTNNVFFDQTTGYAVKNWASYDTSELIVRYNSFLSTDRIALMLPSGFTSSGMTASENYWNTLDTNIIDSMIYDRNDDLSSADYIGYVPVLTEPDPNTPIFLLDQELTIQTDPNHINTVIPQVGQHIINGWADVNATRFIDCPEVYRFDHWEGDVENPNSANTRVFMNTDKIITAVFVDDRQCGDECHPYPAGDISKNCIVDFNDFILFFQSWMECTKPECDL